MAGKVRPRVVGKAAADPTSPGDKIDMRISMEVPGNRGSSAWVTAGVESVHREGETTAEASERIFGFVSETVSNLAEEADRS